MGIIDLLALLFVLMNETSIKIMINSKIYGFIQLVKSYPKFGIIHAWSPNRLVYSQNRKVTDCFIPVHVVTMVTRRWQLKPGSNKRS